MPVECAPRSALTSLPGSALARELEVTDLRALVDFDVVEVLCAAHRMAAWAAAVELSAMSELDRRRMAEAKARGGSEQLAAEFVIDELATALHLTDSAAAVRAAIAWKLAGPLAATGHALAQGRIDFDKVRTICDAVTGLTHTQMTAVQDQILDAAGRCTVGQLRPLLRKAIAAIAPDQHERRTKNAQDSRRVELWPTPDGTVDLCGRDLPETDAHAAYNHLTALARARKQDGDTRPLDHIRADLFLECLHGLSPASSPPKQRRPMPHHRANQSPQARPTASTSQANNRSTPTPRQQPRQGRLTSHHRANQSPQT